MAEQEVTGASPTELKEMQKKFEDSPKGDLYDFDGWYCLFQIPFQPDDYDGPDRRCKKTVEASNGRCRFHENWGKPTPENLDPDELVHDGSQNFKHGGYAMRETILDEMDENERELYEEVLSWAEAYHIDKEEDPAVWDDLKILAVERVRQMKTGAWLFENGETHEVPVFDPEGNIVDHQEEASALSEEHRRITQMVSGLKRDLSLTRKEQKKTEEMSNRTESVETLSETMSEMVMDTDKEFDPDEHEYDPDEEEAADEGK